MELILSTRKLQIQAQKKLLVQPLHHVNRHSCIFFSAVVLIYVA